MSPSNEAGEPIDEPVAPSDSAGETREESSDDAPEAVDPASAPATDPWSAWDAFIAEHIEAGNSKIYDEAVRLTEKHVISRILVHTKGNQVQASELLGITRTTLRNKIKQHGITLTRSVNSIGDE